ncbi:MAG: hypothetical protein NTZ26_13780 [Candidatus Aminicenantes bacterium]|nr:hypothetical protein [Candidatus Aminicenantes bacterium]
MKKFLLWFLAFIIAAGLMAYQRITGPTYPKRGTVSVDGREVKFRLPRSSENLKDCEIAVSILGADVGGYVEFKRYKTEDPYSKFPMVRQDDKLVGFLPKQPRAGKLLYRVVLIQGDKEYPLTGEEPVVIRFRGSVPIWVLIPHVLAMFLAMLLAARAGLAALDKKSKPIAFAKWAAVFLFIAGFILGPLMQYYAFGPFWAGFPLGHDMTDNKTLVAMMGWIIALRAGRKGKEARGWVLAASLLFLIAFLIPHSVFGSELNYTALKPPLK